MTFVPTKRRKRRWIQVHLNNGVCPKNHSTYLRVKYRHDRRHGGELRLSLACWEALDWLSESPIKTLSEAWDKCPQSNWLLWTLARMEPDAKDVARAQKLIAFMLEECRVFIGAITYQELIRIEKSLRICGASEAFWDLDALSSCVVDMGLHGHRESMYQDIPAVQTQIRILWGNPWRMK